MKKQIVSHTLGLFFLTCSVMAQEVSKDSIAALKAEKEAIKSNEKLNEKKTESAKLENQLLEKNEEVKKTAEAAQKSADENRIAAAALMKNPQDKKLAKEAKNAARKANKDSNAANKAVQNQENLTKQIAELKEDIGAQPVAASQAGLITSSATDQRQDNRVQQQVSPAPQPATGAAAGSERQGNAVQPVVVRTSMMDTASNSSNLTQRVIESTYKNYPQQPGQPTIIINNIIVPSDYEKKVPAKDQMTESRMAESDDEEYQQFLAWKRQRNAGVSPKQYGRRRNDAALLDQERESTYGSKITWKERFGERPKRNSGLWVIPMAGVHASSFSADLKNSEADGRVGWNAGLDFRIHMKRFFIQPGAHYFNSSLKQTDKDSLENASLLDGPRIHSLKVPLMLGLYLTKANSGFFKMNIKGGAVGNYVMAVDKSNITYFSKDNIEEFSYGLNAGLGLEFGLLTLDISHEWGMSTYFKSNDQKNNVLRFTLGVKI
jgi:hypothetical protein